MKALTNLASMLSAAALFALALVALGVFCVLGIGMAAAACDVQPTDDVVTRVEHVEPNDIDRQRIRAGSVDRGVSLPADLARDWRFRFRPSASRFSLRESTSAHGANNDIRCRIVPPGSVSAV